MSTQKGVHNRIHTLRWGYPFLYESSLYHLHCLDHRHNFSPYFYPTYLSYPTTIILTSPSTSFLPQLLISLVSGFLSLNPLHPKNAKIDILLTWFIQTFAFILFSKVCTSQYSLWYLPLFPLLLPDLHMSRSKALAHVGVGLVCIFLGVGLRQSQLRDDIEPLDTSTKKMWEDLKLMTAGVPNTNVSVWLELQQPTTKSMLVKLEIPKGYCLPQRLLDQLSVKPNSFPATPPETPHTLTSHLGNTVLTNEETEPEEGVHDIYSQNTTSNPSVTTVSDPSATPIPSTTPTSSASAAISESTISDPSAAPSKSTTAEHQDRAISDSEERMNLDLPTDLSPFKDRTSMTRSPVEHDDHSVNRLTSLVPSSPDIPTALPALDCLSPENSPLSSPLSSAPSMPLSLPNMSADVASINAGSAVAPATSVPPNVDGNLEENGDGSMDVDDSLDDDDDIAMIVPYVRGDTVAWSYEALPDLDSGPQRHCGNPFMMYDVITGAVVMWNGSGHTASQIGWLNWVQARLPTTSELWLHRSSSKIALVWHSTWTSKAEDTWAHFQDVFCDRHILVIPDETAQPPVDLGFTIKLLNKITGENPVKTFTLHDFSNPNGDKNYSAWEFHAPLSTLYEAGKSSSGKILHCLAIPNLDSHYLNGPNPLASSSVVWQSASGLPFLGDFQDFPQSSVEWYTSGLASSYSDFHLDSNGFATRIKILTGTKLWILAIPKDDSPIPYDDIMKAMDHWDADTIDWDHFNLVPILLRLGVELIMKPFTVHVAITIEHCVCSGNQFFAASTLHDTIYANYHLFVYHDTLTNTDHSDVAHQLLHRMLGLVYLKYVHVNTVQGLHTHYPDWLSTDIPAPETSVGLEDIVHLCIMLEFGGALYLPTYDASSTAFDVKMHDNLMAARSLTCSVLKWLDLNIECCGPDGIVRSFWNNFYAPHRFLTFINIYQALLDHAENLPPPNYLPSALEFRCNAYHVFCQDFTWKSLLKFTTQNKGIDNVDPLTIEECIAGVLAELRAPEGWIVNGNMLPLHHLAQELIDCLQIFHTQVTC
ncbi:GPI mannosyltransferase 1 [Leucoagaricus sp. SymC.cos]|nr:GPI mannosyltransferase 1 [Leucoagaricus sp. SymC.cos]